MLLLLSENNKSKSGNNEKHYVDHVTVDALNNMIKEVFTPEMSELKFINCKCEEITYKLLPGKTRLLWLHTR